MHMNAICCKVILLPTLFAVQIRQKLVLLEDKNIFAPRIEAHLLKHLSLQQLQWLLEPLQSSCQEKTPASVVVSWFRDDGSQNLTKVTDIPLFSAPKRFGAFWVHNLMKLVFYFLRRMIFFSNSVKLLELSWSCPEQSTPHDQHIKNHVMTREYQIKPLSLWNTPRCSWALLTSSTQ